MNTAELVKLERKRAAQWRRNNRPCRRVRASNAALVFALVAFIGFFLYLTLRPTVLLN